MGSGGGAEGVVLAVGTTIRSQHRVLLRGKVFSPGVAEP